MAKTKDPPTTNMISMARELYDYKQQIEQHEEMVKVLEEKSKELERELVEHIKETYGEKGGNSFDIENGVKAVLTTRTHPSIISGQEPVVHKWLREKGYPSAVREYVFPQTFKKIIGDIAEKEEKDVKDIVNLELVNAVTVFVEKKISFRKK